MVVGEACENAFAGELKKEFVWNSELLHSLTHADLVGGGEVVHPIHFLLNHVNLVFRERVFAFC